MSALSILVIDNHRDLEDFGAVPIVKGIQQTVEADIMVRRAPDSDLPKSPNPFQRIIVSGSRTSCFSTESWIKPYEDFLIAAIQKGIPILGICMGHQTIAKIIGGEKTLQASKTYEKGWFQVHKTGKSFLLADLPSSFWVYQNHREEVGTLPSGFVKTSQSPACGIESMENENKLLFSVQFHPEKIDPKAPGGADPDLCRKIFTPFLKKL